MEFFFTTGQVAKELKVSDQTIRNLCASSARRASGWTAACSRESCASDATLLGGL